MEKQDNGAYEQYQALKGGQRFDFSTLGVLFAAGNHRYTWNDGVMLAALVWNLSHGRPTMPTLVDAICAERDRDSLKTLYQYAIVELPVTNPDCWKFKVLILPHGSAEPFAEFEATMVAERDVKRPWYVQDIVGNSLRVHSIAEPGFIDRRMHNTKDPAGRFSRYTIFDNLTEAVSMTGQGTLYLQCLEEQIEEYAGEDMRDLFHKFRAYADCMLEMHEDYVLSVRYEQICKDHVRLAVSVYADENIRKHIVQFYEVLKKRAD